MNLTWPARNNKFTLRLALVWLLFLVLVALKPEAARAAQVQPELLEQLAKGGETDFLVLMKGQANLEPAFRINNWDARGKFVHNRLEALANQTQARLRQLLQSRGASFRPFWIVNAIHVRGDEALAKELAAQPEVDQIVASPDFRIPEPVPGTPQQRVNDVEWNINRIGADQVWSAFGVTGQGIVVANIDTGVQYDHPALVNQYRGNTGGGFNHDYNWFDPSEICGPMPSGVPCDNNGHGTHTMGTMVGDDGGANQIGVAPGARWIAAKGCESDSCSGFALLASGQWILAPTDRNGGNPRPDLRPHIVNNSWGGGPGDPWYQAMVQAWVASGIFPAFAAGNDGDWGCYYASSPGDYPESYAAGAFDIYDGIAFFSGRGPSALDGGIKPNLAAPGVDIRSSVPPGAYESKGGTSMASPHVAGTAALMWSAAPLLVGDITSTRDILDQTAIDTDDTSCGGDAKKNNVWGEGKVDALQAVSWSPRGPSGTLQGTVTDAATSLPIEGTEVVTVGPVARTEYTDPAGSYVFPYLPVGSYDVTVRKFAYAEQVASGVTVSDGVVTVQDFALAPVPTYSVDGYVLDAQNNPIAYATVAVLGTPIPPATTDATGYYQFMGVPEGTYDVRAKAGACFSEVVQPLVLTGPVSHFNFTLAARTDEFGYFCRVEGPSWISADNPLFLYWDDAATEVVLPFSFPFYGMIYYSAFISTNGFLNFLALNTAYSNGPIPEAQAPWLPDAAIYPFWDDLFVDPADADVYVRLLDTPPFRQFVIEWRNIRPLYEQGKLFDIEVVLQENGEILMQYRNVDEDELEKGGAATLGIENETGTIALQYSYNEPVIVAPEFAVRYLPPEPTPTVTVTPGTCQGKCGGRGVGGCWCDPACKSYGDCCPDYDQQCLTPTATPTLTAAQTATPTPTVTVTPGTCQGKCGGKGIGDCWCDSACKSYGDCCPDYDQQCQVTKTCQGKCGGKGIGDCWCDPACKSYGDCCPDYDQQCPSVYDSDGTPTENQTTLQ